MRNARLSGKGKKSAASVAGLLAAAMLLSILQTTAVAMDPPVPFGIIGEPGPADFYVTDLSSDAAGNVYLVDRYYGTVKKYALDGTELMSFAASGMSLPRTLAVDAAGRVLVGLPNRGEIFVFAATGELVDLWTGFPSVADLHVDNTGRVLLTTGSSTSSVHAVIVLDGDGNELFRFGSLGSGAGQFRRPYGIYSGGDGSIVVTDLNNSRVQKFDASGNHLLTFGSSGNGPGQFGQHKGVAVDSEGNIFVADRGNDRVQKFDADGNYLLEWGTRGHDPGQFFEMEGIMVTSDDNVWVAGYQQHDVPYFTNDGVYLGRFFGAETGPGEFATVRGNTVADDKLFIVDYWSHWVQVFDAWTGRYLYQFGERDGGAATVFNFPNAITAGQDGDVYVTGNVLVRRMHPDGTFVNVFQRPSGAAPSAGGLVADSNGRLYQSDFANKRINLYDTATGFVTAEWSGPGSGAGELNKPGELDLSADETLIYIADTKNSRVQVFSDAGDYVFEWPTGSQPIGLTIDHRRNLVYVGSSTRIAAYDFTGTEQFAWGSSGSAPGQFSGLYSISATDDAVFVSESGNNRVQRFVYPSAFEGRPQIVPGTELAVHVWRIAPEDRWNKNVPNWHLRLVGDGTDYDYTVRVTGTTPFKTAQAREQETGDNFTFDGAFFELSGQIGSDEEGADFLLYRASTLTVEVTIDGVVQSVPVRVGSKGIDPGTAVIDIPGIAPPMLSVRQPVIGLHPKNP